jgi:3-phosphoshikimate 1-carboxyvinyltransferase
METLDLHVMPTAHGTVKLPGSKSVSNRALLLAALAEGTTTLHNLLDSDDTRVMRGALDVLGVPSSAGADYFSVDGQGGRFPHRSGSLFVGNSGTAARSLIATLAMVGGDYAVDGVARMRERPIGDLVDALRVLGAHIDYRGQAGFPPLHIGRGAIALDRPIPVRGDVSSQFLTGLLMALPAVTHAQNTPATVEVIGELISKPYIEITLAMMQQFGVSVTREGWQRFHVPAKRYTAPGDYAVEGDASSASYFLAAGALAGDVTVQGVGEAALQGDVKFVDALRAMGASITAGPTWLRAQRGPQGLRGIDADMNHIPDAAMTLVPLAMFAQGPTTLRNIASWRVKETDRIAAMATEARKFGATIEEGADFIRVTPLPLSAVLPSNVAVDTYDDHRMAMCFALMSVGARGTPLRINDPACVNKTFPDYFARLATLR